MAVSVQRQEGRFLMEANEQQGAFISALTTEHFVLQTAASSTISEAAARSSLYVLSLSSALVAMGFASQAPGVFMPFAAAVLPAVVLLGVFTTVRLVDTALENMQYLAAIAQIRSYYRTLTPEAPKYFAAAVGRWPEARSTPSLRLGPLFAFLGTTASMIAFINSVVAGAGAALLVRFAVRAIHIGTALLCGAACAALFMVVFLAYQRWRFSIVELALRPVSSG
jgi:hypothetical protein